MAPVPSEPINLCAVYVVYACACVHAIVFASVCMSSEYKHNATTTVLMLACVFATKSGYVEGIKHELILTVSLYLHAAAAAAYT